MYTDRPRRANMSPRPRRPREIYPSIGASRLWCFVTVRVTRGGGRVMKLPRERGLIAESTE